MSALYYSILDLEPGCSLFDIKRAYREKAKEYHPDLNHSPDAQERFIEVNEAYEFFIRQFSRPGREKIVRDGTSINEMEEIFQQWMQKERIRARARAAQYARRRYEEFRRSPLYRTSNYLSIGADYFALGFGIMTMAGPLYGIYYVAKTYHVVTGAAIFAAVLTSLVGLILILFSASDIKHKRKKLRSGRY